MVVGRSTKRISGPLPMRISTAAGRAPTPGRRATTGVNRDGSAKASVSGRSQSGRESPSTVTG